MKLEAVNIAIGYKSPVVSDVSFAVSEGECILLCGANGTGKTTLMRTIADIIMPLGGEIRRNCNVVMMPSRIAKVKGFTVRDFMRTGLYASKIWDAGVNSGREEAVSEAVALLGLGTLADKDIASLSDGEFQKACIASAVSRKAGVIILDEPTSFLDVENRISVMNVLRNLCDSTGCSVIFSSHDIAESIKVCTRVFGITSEKKFLDSLPEGDKKGVIASCFRNYSSEVW